MKTEDFDYSFPDELIARYPLSKRSESRLMHLNRETGQTAHHQFLDLPGFLKAGDCLVFNNSRVMPARLLAHKLSGGKVEILVERILNDHEGLVHLGSNKPIKPGTRLQLLHSQIEVLERVGQLWKIRACDQALKSVLAQEGHIPLPPYLNRADELSDRERYQTVYAKPEGSAAAPTAGLHFDQALLDQLRAQGVLSAEVTLHVGAGTFQPVRTPDLKDHVMHSEWIEVSESTCQTILQAKAAGGRIIAVGTTAVRSLETASRTGELKPFSGDSQLFLYPGCHFQTVDGMITNFHQPQSTLLMLVSAFVGRERILAAYQEAIERRYRLFSYGDAMLLL